MEGCQSARKKDPLSASIGGAGSSTLTGSGGANLFEFTKVVGGGAATITDFNTNNSVLLQGYGVGAADAALQSATTSGSSTILTLSDNTKITFLNVTTSQLTGHITFT